MPVAFAACYSKEERALVREYKSQAEINAVAYGDEMAYNVTEAERNGLVAQYFDGKNLKEIFTGNHVTTDVSASYINQEIENFDVEKIKEQTGINQFLFVDYDSKDSYDTIVNSREIQMLDTHQNLPYINEYLAVNSGETKYVGCEKKMVDGILFVTEYPEETVTVNKLSGFSNNFSKKNAEIVFDVYSLDTESEIVYVFVPIDLLTPDRGDWPGIVCSTGSRRRRIYQCLFYG